MNHFTFKFTETLTVKTQLDKVVGGMVNKRIGEGRRGSTRDTSVTVRRIRVRGHRDDGFSETFY